MTEMPEVMYEWWGTAAPVVVMADETMVPQVPGLLFFSSAGVPVTDNFDRRTDEATSSGGEGHRPVGVMPMANLTEIWRINGWLIEGAPISRRKTDVNTASQPNKDTPPAPEWAVQHRDLERQRPYRFTPGKPHTRFKEGINGWSIEGAPVSRRKADVNTESQPNKDTPPAPEWAVQHRDLERQRPDRFTPGMPHTRFKEGINGWSIEGAPVSRRKADVNTESQPNKDTPPAPEWAVQHRDLERQRPDRFTPGMPHTRFKEGINGWSIEGAPVSRRKADVNTESQPNKDTPPAPEWAVQHRDLERQRPDRFTPGMPHTRFKEGINGWPIENAPVSRRKADVNTESQPNKDTPPAPEVAVQHRDLERQRPDRFTPGMPHTRFKEGINGWPIEGAPVSRRKADVNTESQPNKDTPPAPEWAVQHRDLERQRPDRFTPGMPHTRFKEGINGWSIEGAPVSRRKADVNTESQPNKDTPPAPEWAVQHRDLERQRPDRFTPGMPHTRFKEGINGWSIEGAPVSRRKADVNTESQPNKDTPPAPEVAVQHRDLERQRPDRFTPGMPHTRFKEGINGWPIEGAPVSRRKADVNTESQPNKDTPPAPEWAVQHRDLERQRPDRFTPGMPHTRFKEGINGWSIEGAPVSRRKADVNTESQPNKDTPPAPEWAVQHRDLERQRPDRFTPGMPHTRFKEGINGWSIEGAPVSRRKADVNTESQPNKDTPPAPEVAVQHRDLERQRPDRFTPGMPHTRFKEGINGWSIEGAPVSRRKADVNTESQPNKDTPPAPEWAVQHRDLERQRPDRFTPGMPHTRFKEGINGRSIEGAPVSRRKADVNTESQPNKDTPPAPEVAVQHRDLERQRPDRFTPGMPHTRFKEGINGWSIEGAPVSRRKADVNTESQPNKDTPPAPEVAVQHRDLERQRPDRFTPGMPHTRFKEGINGWSIEGAPVSRRKADVNTESQPNKDTPPAPEWAVQHRDLERQRPDRFTPGMPHTRFKEGINGRSIEGAPVSRRKADVNTESQPNKDTPPAPEVAVQHRDLERQRPDRFTPGMPHTRFKEGINGWSIEGAPVSRRKADVNTESQPNKDTPPAPEWAVQHRDLERQRPDRFTPGMPHTRFKEGINGWSIEGAPVSRRKADVNTESQPNKDTPPAPEVAVQHRDLERQRPDRFTPGMPHTRFKEGINGWSIEGAPVSRRKADVNTESQPNKDTPPAPEWAVQHRDLERQRPDRFTPGMPHTRFKEGINGRSIEGAPVSRRKADVNTESQPNKDTPPAPEVAVQHRDLERQRPDRFTPGMPHTRFKEGINGWSIEGAPVSRRKADVNTESQPNKDTPPAPEVAVQHRDLERQRPDRFTPGMPHTRFKEGINGWSIEGAPVSRRKADVNTESQPNKDTPPAPEWAVQHRDLERQRPDRFTPGMPHTRFKEGINGRSIEGAPVSRRKADVNTESQPNKDTPPAPEVAVQHRDLERQRPDRFTPGMPHTRFKEGINGWSIEGAPVSRRKADVNTESQPNKDTPPAPEWAVQHRDLERQRPDRFTPGMPHTRFKEGINGWSIEGGPVSRRKADVNTESQPNKDTPPAPEVAVQHRDLERQRPDRFTPGMPHTRFKEGINGWSIEGAPVSRRKADVNTESQPNKDTPPAPEWAVQHRDLERQRPDRFTPGMPHTRFKEGINGWSIEGGPVSRRKADVNTESQPNKDTPPAPEVAVQHRDLERQRPDRFTPGMPHTRFKEGINGWSIEGAPVSRRKADVNTETQPNKDTPPAPEWAVQHRDLERQRPDRFTPGMPHTRFKEGINGWPIEGAPVSRRRADVNTESQPNQDTPPAPEWAVQHRDLERQRPDRFTPGMPHSRFKEGINGWSIEDAPVSRRKTDVNTESQPNKDTPPAPEWAVQHRDLERQRPYWFTPGKPYTRFKEGAPFGSISHIKSPVKKFRHCKKGYKRAAERCVCNSFKPAYMTIDTKGARLGSINGIKSPVKKFRHYRKGRKRAVGRRVCNSFKPAYMTIAAKGARLGSINGIKSPVKKFRHYRKGRKRAVGITTVCNSFKPAYMTFAAKGARFRPFSFVKHPVKKTRHSCKGRKRVKGRNHVFLSTKPADMKIDATGFFLTASNSEDTRDLSETAEGDSNKQPGSCEYKRRDERHINLSTQEDVNHRENEMARGFVKNNGERKVKIVWKNKSDVYRLKGTQPPHQFRRSDLKCTCLPGMLLRQGCSVLKIKKYNPYTSLAPPTLEQFTIKIVRTASGTSHGEEKATANQKFKTVHGTGVTSKGEELTKEPTEHTTVNEKTSHRYQSITATPKLTTECGTEATSQGEEPTKGPSAHTTANEKTSHGYQSTTDTSKLTTECGTEATSHGEEPTKGPSEHTTASEKTSHEYQLTTATPNLTTECGTEATSQGEEPTKGYSEHITTNIKTSHGEQSTAYNLKFKTVHDTGAILHGEEPTKGSSEHTTTNEKTSHGYQSTTATPKLTTECDTEATSQGEEPTKGHSEHTTTNEKTSHGEQSTTATLKLTTECSTKATSQGEELSREIAVRVICPKCKSIIDPFDLEII
ncbi:hypothetical protein AAG570_005304 [Ranatra chinensis]|uniref:Uncharacterized protein n=1 Tax=Ranatra chinensis TaxID=642074 RepID=A0ABD0YLU5_9HEMI